MSNFGRNSKKHLLMGLALGALFAVAALAAPAGAQYYDQSANCGSAEQLWGPLSGSATGAIQFDGDVDVFEINVGSGTLIVQTDGPTDTFGTLLSGAYGCPAIASNDDDGFERNFYIQRPVTAGKYFIAVRHYLSFGRGEYTLHYRLLPPPPPPVVDRVGDTCDTATLIPSRPGTFPASSVYARGEISGNIERPGDVDVFRIEVNCTAKECRSDKWLRELTTGINWYTYFWVTLYDSRCRPITLDDSIPQTIVKTIWPIPRRATFYVGIQPTSPTRTGPYDLFYTVALARKR